MVQKSYENALVWIPPQEVWPSIQAIRHQYDRNIHRWMPHITLMYPFAPRSSFAGIAARLSSVCRVTEPFDVSFGQFRCFRKRHESVMWLAPEPSAPWLHLHSTLLEWLPDYADTARFSGGFTPHLSMGQRRKSIESFVQSLQAHWAPVQCTVDSICLISRNAPPDDVFHVIHRLPLGDTE